MESTSSVTSVEVLKRLGLQVKVARDELKNIRQKLNSLSKQHSMDACKLQNFLKSVSLDEGKEITEKLPEEENYFKFTPIGFINTLYNTKNGTPRQGSISPASKGWLELNKSLFTNPEHYLDGLHEYSHVWLIFVFHKNENVESGKPFTKAKVHPPRLDGRSVGVFATRSPFRPNALGLTLTRLERIFDGVLYFSGLDLVDGTPVLDIKPYIPDYDKPYSAKVDDASTSTVDIHIRDEFSKPSTSKVTFCPEVAVSEIPRLSDLASSDNNYLDFNPHNPYNYNLSPSEKKTSHITTRDSDYFDLESVKSASWISNPETSRLSVSFTLRAQKNLVNFHASGSHSGTKCEWCFQKLTTAHEAKQAISDVLTEDPRSVYRRKKCNDKLYYFTIDSIHITAWFDDSCSPPVAEVVRIIPSYQKQPT